MLAMEARHGHELVENARLVVPPALTIPLDDGRHEFTPRCHTHLPHPPLRRSNPTRSKSDEATHHHLGAIQARQCVGQRRPVVRNLLGPPNGTGSKPASPEASESPPPSLYRARPAGASRPARDPDSAPFG